MYTNDSLMTDTDQFMFHSFPFLANTGNRWQIEVLLLSTQQESYQVSSQGFLEQAEPRRPTANYNVIEYFEYMVELLAASYCMILIYLSTFHPKYIKVKICVPLGGYPSSSSQHITRYIAKYNHCKTQIQVVYVGNLKSTQIHNHFMFFIFDDPGHPSSEQMISRRNR